MKLKQLLLSTLILTGAALASPVLADEVMQPQTKDITNAEKIEHLKAEQITLESTIKSVKAKMKTAKTETSKATALTVPGLVTTELNASDTLEKQLNSLEAEKNTVESKRIALEKQEIKEKEKAEAEAKAAQEAKEKAEAEAKAAQEAKEKAEAEAKAQTAVEKAQQGTITTGSVPAIQHESGNTYPVGQCTWGVKQLAPWVGNWWGNANMWVDSARARGFRVGTTPIPGSVAMWPNDGGGYGHVAYVTDVESANRIKVAESNYAGNQYISDFRGWFDPTAGGPVYYIYPN